MVKLFWGKSCVGCFAFENGVFDFASVFEFMKLTLFWLHNLPYTRSHFDSSRVASELVRATLVCEASPTRVCAMVLQLISKRPAGALPNDEFVVVNGISYQLPDYMSKTEAVRIRNMSVPATTCKKLWFPITEIEWFHSVEPKCMSQFDSMPVRVGYHPSNGDLTWVENYPEEEGADGSAGGASGVDVSVNKENSSGTQEGKITNCRSLVEGLQKQADKAVKAAVDKLLEKKIGKVSHKVTMKAAKVMKVVKKRAVSMKVSKVMKVAKKPAVSMKVSKVKEVLKKPARSMKVMKVMKVMKRGDS